MKKADLLRQQLDRIDEIYRKSGMLQDSEQEIRSVLAASRKIGWEEGAARSTYHLGRIKEWIREIPEAEKLTVEAKDLAEKLGLKSLYADCLASEANLYLWNNNLKEAYTIASDTIVQGEKAGNDHAITLSRYVLGSVCERYGSDSESLTYFQDALGIARKHQFLKLEAVIQDKLSQFFLNRLQFRHAERYARAAAYIQQRLKNQRSILRAKIQLASILIESNKLEEANELIKEVSRNENDLLVAESGTLQMCIGKIAQRMKKYSEAITAYNAAIQIFMKTGRNLLIANAYSVFSEMHMEMNHPQEALASAKQALAFIEPGTNSYMETQVHRLMYEASKLTNNTGDALKYLELYHQETAKQEGQLLESRIQFIELQAEYEMKQSEINEERHQAEQLRIDLGKKERELTTKTQHLIKQTEALAQFRDDLRAMIRSSPANDPLIRELKERLNETPEINLNWEDFNREFQSVHPIFNQKLNEKHPILSNMEKKICSMLRLGLTTIDIARLLALSERNIENHRYRIRKKIALDTEKSLHEYLAAI
jgi:DNA-binding CsgD family transcriptional regulator